MAMRKTYKIALITLLVLTALLALAFANRLTVLTYSLGWYNNIVYPRDENRPVPWQSGPAQATLSPAQRPPNIVLILADDMGINDVSMHGGGHTAIGVPTPAIDSLARNGVRFDAGYAGSAVCTVSRAALMTGRYPWRFGVEFTPTPGAMARVLPRLAQSDGQMHRIEVDQDKASRTPSFEELGMPPSELTLAELLNKQGYHSMHIGKWHLGQTASMRPNNQGFAESLNMEGLLYWPEASPDVVNSKQTFDPIDRFLWGNGRESVSFNGGKQFKPAKYLTDYFTDEAVNAIKQNKNRPFFLYLGHWGVHTPLQAAKADYDALAHIADHRLRVYAAMVRAVDRSVARVLQTLREQGLEENTIVIFTSDNGAPGYLGLPMVNQPYRGWKLTFFEGGIRVPYALQWPARIAPGTVHKAPVSNIDILPTVLAASGATLPPDRVIDGLNLLPLLGKDAAAPTPRPLFWRDGSHRAVQAQGWKLIVSERPAKSWLFHLTQDPTERVNLWDKEPAKAAQLKAMMDAHHAPMPAPLWGSFIQAPVLIDKTLDQKQQPSDEYTYWLN